MRKKMNNIRKFVLLVFVIQAVILGVLYAVREEVGIVPAVIVLILELILYFYVSERFRSLSEEQSVGIQKYLGDTAKEAYLYGGVGMVAYDDQYTVTWVSELFDNKEFNRLGMKLLVWIPEADDLISGKADSVELKLDDRVYMVKRKEDSSLLLFHDITDLNQYQEAYKSERPVIGMASLDNYEESTQYEEEATVSAINVAVRSPLTEYCRDHGILMRRVNNYRYILVMNEKIYQELQDDNFSIVKTVRTAAQKQEVSITLSMAFARGSDNFQTLDEMVTNLMDLAQSRGGDQVAVQQMGGDVKYFGGSTEATEKRSRVRVRVMAHTLRELITRSSNVIICGHREQDFDCMGAALGVAAIARALKKHAVIIAKTGGVEEKLAPVLEANEELLKEEVTFVTENEALNQLQDKSLVIMVDHHNIKQSNGSKVLENAKTIAIIDHHRRSTEMGVKPVFVYIEAGASSACELITELFPYVSNQVEISELDATIMLTGMTIDTNRFRIRTGVRTYDAASQLRRRGADPVQTNIYLKDTYQQFMDKSSILAMSKAYPNNVVVVPVKGKLMTRSGMSQVADSLLQVQNVEAAFVIANTIDDETAISARSAGNVNVQVIMESMGGGGHMTAAAMQRQKTTVDELERELSIQMNHYFKEESRNESDSEK